MRKQRPTNRHSPHAKLGRHLECRHTQAQSTHLQLLNPAGPGSDTPLPAGLGHNRPPTGGVSQENREEVTVNGDRVERSVGGSGAGAVRFRFQRTGRIETSVVFWCAGSSVGSGNCYPQDPVRALGALRRTERTGSRDFPLRVSTLSVVGIDRGKHIGDHDRNPPSRTAGPGCVCRRSGRTSDARSARRSRAITPYGLRHDHSRDLRNLLIGCAVCLFFGRVRRDRWPLDTLQDHPGQRLRTRRGVGRQSLVSP